MWELNRLQVIKIFGVTVTNCRSLSLHVQSDITSRGQTLYALRVMCVRDSVPNSTTRTPATDMLYNTTNGRAHNNSTTCCTTDSPPTDQNLPHPNIFTKTSRCWALALRCGKFVVPQVVELLWARPLVVLYKMSVAGVRVVEFGTYATAHRKQSTECHC